VERRLEEVAHGSSLADSAPVESPGADRERDSKAGAMLLLGGPRASYRRQFDSYGRGGGGDAMLL